jgi:ABC-type uncharacterized transport system involved in gliding motility auxiliary subunit
MNRIWFIVTLVLILAAFVLVNLIAATIPTRIDTTRDKLYSLSDASVEIIRRVPEPLQIVHFYIANDPRYGPTLELLREYERRGVNVTTRAYDINTNPSIARSMDVRFQGTTIITMGERREEVYGGDEVSITNGIFRILNDTERVVYFTSGHGEYDIFSMVSEDHLEAEGDENRPIFVHEKRGLAKLRERLELLGYDVRALYLLHEGQVPDDADLVVIASPESNFLPAEVTALRDFATQGGRLFVMLDAFRDGGLAPLLADFGVLPQNDMVVDFGNHYWNDATAPATATYQGHPITQQLPLTFFPGVQSLQLADPLPDGVSAQVLFSSTSRSLAVSEIGQLSQLRNLDLPVRSYDLMVAAERQTSAGKALLAVIGDGDVAANEYINTLGNERLVLNTIKWLVADESRLNLPPVSYELPLVNLTNAQMQFTFILTTVLLPGLLVVSGVGVWLVRRRNT